MMIPHDELLKDLSYAPETGIFTWIRPKRKVIVGSPAGSIGSGGYVYIKLRQKKYLAHRLAWFYMNARWPSDEIDHINHITTDNRLSNLREATISQNRTNRVRSKSGLRGAYFNIKNGRKHPWSSQINLEGKTVRIGSYSTEIEAHRAFCDYAASIRGEFFCDGIKIAHPVDNDI